MKTPKLDPQMLRFALVGSSNFLVGWVNFQLFLWLFGSWVLAGTFAQALSYLSGVAWSYYWNRRWTFASEAKVGSEATRFVLLQGFMWASSTAAVGFAVDVMGWNPTLSWLVVMVFLTLVSFFGMKFWVFNRPDQNAA